MSFVASFSGVAGVGKAGEVDRDSSVMVVVFKEESDIKFTKVVLEHGLVRER